MTQVKKCVAPACQDAQLVKNDMESSPGNERFYCPRCGRIYNCPTRLAKAGQIFSVLSGMAIVGTFVVHLVTMEWDSALDHAAENLDQLFN
jgi:hypothetical protein